MNISPFNLDWMRVQTTVCLCKSQNCRAGVHVLRRNPSQVLQQSITEDVEGDLVGIRGQSFAQYWESLELRHSWSCKWQPPCKFCSWKITKQFDFQISQWKNVRDLVWEKMQPRLACRPGKISGAISFLVKREAKGRLQTLQRLPYRLASGIRIVSLYPVVRLLVLVILFISLNV